jgi:hypothetical protein
VSIDALLLALTSIVRPTSAAAVIAMLSARHPHRLLLAYVVVGIGFSVAVGTIVIGVSQSLGQEEAHAAGRPILDVVLGVAAIGYAVATGFGWLPRPRERDEERDRRVSSEWIRTRLQRLTPSGAAAAGVLTHLPGLVYLAALNAIVATTTRTVDGILQVVVYNAIWFSVAILALAVSFYRPSLAEVWLARASSWARRHRRPIIVVLLGVVGAYLLVVGILGLDVRFG